MESKKLGDLTINGYGASNGGLFRHVVLNGKGTVNTDVECEDFECNGMGTLKGNLQCRTAKISGNGKILGTVNSTVMEIDGRGKIENHVAVKKLNVSGYTSIKGNVKGGEIRVKGRLVIGGHCDADIFKGDCHFTIGGLLNAEKVDIQLFGECTAKEIGGQSIVVRQKSSFIANLLKPLFQNRLETDLIEGDHIELQGVNAKVVRGNHVIIGQNCNIGLIEYSETFTQDKAANVAESRKI